MADKKLRPIQEDIMGMLKLMSLPTTVSWICECLKSKYTSKEVELAVFQLRANDIIKMNSTW